MADNFGLKIGVEGEKEFKKALSDINQSFKVLGSEMQLVTSQFDKQDKSVQALTARNEVLNKQIDAQKAKIETLRAALKNASDSFGENDRRTQNWQIQLNKAQAELNGMERELSQSTEGADNLGDELKESGDEAEKSGSKFEKLSGVLKGVGVVMGAVVVAAGAAAVKLGKEVVAAYADYEQLVGGVDTLFKDFSAAVQSYAANAFKTAGMSANEYMETVTSFSASLIQSLGGDTAKAAKAADTAITDMSDNANKMGTDISSIQDAYQGFAKQNYTMLDNLKLGYGGTKTEMERLLSDAEKLSGQKYDISNLNDVYAAIHVIQTEMGITGTTAKEATETISGSIAGMQSAVGNLTAGLGDADADIQLLIGNVVEAFQNVVKNITPVIENIVAALPAALDGILQAVGELLPTLLSTVVSLFTQVLDTLLTLLPQLIPAAVDAVMTIVSALISSLPLLIDAAVQLVTASTEPGTYTKYGLWTIDTLDVYSSEQVSNTILCVAAACDEPAIAAPKNGSATYNPNPRVLMTTGAQPNEQAVQVKIGTGNWWDGVNNPSLFSPSGAVGGSAAVMFKAETQTAGTKTITVRCVNPDFEAPSAEVVRSFTVLASPFEEIAANETKVKASHITALRTAVNTVRNYYGLAPVSWGGEMTAGRTEVKNWPLHILEIRAAVEPVIAVINQYSTDSGFGVPEPDWEELGTGRPRAAVMNQLAELILSL